MSDPQVLEQLQSMTLLEGVSKTHLAKLAAVAHIVDLDEGTTIFREGEAGTHVYIIISGRVALEICSSGVGCRRILTVDGGELLGWSPVLDHEKLTATARALSPVRAVKLAGADIRGLCEEYPRLGYEFMRCAALALGKRLSATRLQLLDVYGGERSEKEATAENGDAS
ncbi:MAG: Crp/Fnr family transcriptional regulator [Pirellulales bacterium]|nr:Crp/Fnr family transcriptional regulator [Planctomycetales bacterium]